MILNNPKLVLTSITILFSSVDGFAFSPSQVVGAKNGQLQSNFLSTPQTRDLTRYSRFPYKVSPPLEKKLKNSLFAFLKDSVDYDDKKTRSLLQEELDDALNKGSMRRIASILKRYDDDDRKEWKLDLSREQWNKIFDVIEMQTSNVDENTTQQQLSTQNIEFPAQSAVRNEMTELYKSLKQSGILQLFGAMDVRSPLASGITSVPPTIMEDIIHLPMKALTPQPNNSLLLAGVVVAIAEGLLSARWNVPLDALVLSTLFAVSIDRLALNGAGFESLLRVLNPGVQNKILRHEAGHFLAAYLLGCPVEGIVLSAWAALKDKRFGSRQVSAGTSFFDAELSQQINGGQTVTRSAIDRYSIIVMAGIAAEADNYGRADGGAGDEMALVAFLSQLNGNNSGRQGWDSEKIRNQARWGAMQAVLLLREYKPAYDALVDALERGASLGECILAIEKAARKHGLGPVQRPVGYIVEKETSKAGEGGATMIDAQKIFWKKNEKEDAIVTTESDFENAVVAESTESGGNGVKESDDEEELLRQYKQQVKQNMESIKRRLSEMN